MDIMEDRFKKGMDILNIINEGNIEKVFESVEGVAPDLGRFVVEFPYSEIYTRENVDLKTRELCTIAALTALGHPQKQLKSHVDGALNIGVKAEEIVEIIMQMSAYAGFPAALNGILTAKEVFEERNLLPLENTKK